MIQVTLICDSGHRTVSLTEEASELGFNKLQVHGDAHAIDEDDALIGKRK